MVMMDGELFKSFINKLLVILEKGLNQ